MTRTTVYRGTPDNHEDDPIADEYHTHEHDDAVVIKHANGEYRIPNDDWVDIYVDGEPVEE